MNIFLVFIIGIVIGGGVVWLVLQNRKSNGLIEKQIRKKEEAKRKILGFLEKRDTITNNEVEDLLGVSDATATNYFDELEKEGLLEQVGRTGKSVFYRKPNG